MVDCAASFIFPIMQPVEQILLQVCLQAGNWTVHEAAKTESIHPTDGDEIAGWFTGSEQELTLRCDPFNLFFHPLPSGRYALGVIHPDQRTVFPFFKQTPKHSVHILLIPPETLLQFGNHPLALFELLRQQIPFTLPLPKPLLPLVPPTASLHADFAPLKKLTHRLGAMALAQLTQSLFIAESTLFTSKSVSALSVLSALFDLLPIPYRLELTFSSDFFLSARNSFRLSGFSKLPQRTLRLMKQWGLPIISLERSHKGSEETLDPWARFVYQLLQTENFAFLGQQQFLEYQQALRSPMNSLMNSPPVLWDNLNEAGVALSKAMRSGTLPEKLVSATEFSAHTLEELRCAAAIDQMLPILPGLTQNAVPSANDQRLGDQFPPLREELSALEAYLVRGIFGDETALSNIKRIWQQLLTQLDAEVRISIQETVLATIHAVLTSLDSDTEHRLLRSSQLLELMLFFADAHLRTGQT